MAIPPKETVVPGVEVPTAREFVWRVPMEDDAELKYCIVDDAKEMSPFVYVWSWFQVLALVVAAKYPVAAVRARVLVKY